MFQKLVSHNHDIKKLVEKGYAVTFDSNCMVIRDIPYLDSEGNCLVAAIVCKLIFKDKEHVIQDDHQIFFSGSAPYNIDGTPIPNLAGGETTISLSPDCSDVIVQRSFSNKPKAAGKFGDFYEKIESYVAIISGPALAKGCDSPYTFRSVKNDEPESVFKLHDTLTSKAEITELSAKLENDVIAVIGLGGTGAYLLDFLVKTPVREIRAYDLDDFHVHNAFRSPGRLNDDELDKTKAAVYQDRYDSFRTGLSLHPKFIDSSSAGDFKGVTFAFVCVDKGSARSEIFDLLISKKIPFIDVGMGLKQRDKAITGLVRTTYFSAQNAQNVLDGAGVPTTDNDDNMYNTNIQISELNALNASMAVIKFKQLRGFYVSDTLENNFLFGVNDLHTAGTEL